MKKIVKFFPVLILIVISILTVILEDMKEKELYKNINGYYSTGFMIPENTENITNDDIDKVLKSAKEYNVILVKTVYDQDNNSVDNYVSGDDIYTLYSKQLDIKEENTDDTLGITTYRDKSTLYYPDFLNNDRYSFYPANIMEDREIYRFGSYLIYYQNEVDYLNFIDNAKEILKVPTDLLSNEFFGQLNEPIYFFNMATVLSIAFFGLFNFVLVVFLFYRDSKKIGILTLLGYSNVGILKNTLKNYSLRIIITSILLFIVSLLILPNIKFSILIKLIEIDIIILVVSILISYFALLFLQKFFSLSNILKKQSIVRKISDLCLICKFVMISCMILITINCLPLIQESVEASRNLKDNKILMDYAVFPRIRLENNEYDDYDKYLKFYKEIENHNIDYVYVDFSEYLEKDKEIIENYNLSELNGIAFRIASIDLNYLDLYDVLCFNSDGKAINIEDIKQELYLLPMSKKEYTNGLNSNIKKKYERYNITDDVLIYYYEDRAFDTFDSQMGIKVVDSPIFRVINISNPFTYFENSYGIDVAGTGMNTALKFNVSNIDHFYQHKLLQCIKDSGLEEVLVEENFVQYKDYYNELITRVYNTNTIFISGISFCLCIYVFMIFQTFALFIDARKKEILVKSLIGFNRKDIFENVILWNVGATLFPICCICAYSFTSRVNNLLLILCVCAIFFIIDLIMLLIITRTIKLTKIYIELKGE